MEGTSVGPTRRPADARREALVRAAFGQIASRGFEGLRTREVAQQVGVNVATLHYYFPSKESLIQGVVGHAVARFRSTLTPHGEPGEQLAAHLHAVADLLSREPDLAAVMSELALRSRRDPQIASILEGMSEGWRQTVAALLRRAAGAGAISQPDQADQLAALIVAVLSSFTLPVMGQNVRSHGALEELTRRLGLQPQSTD